MSHFSRVFSLLFGGLFFLFCQASAQFNTEFIKNGGIAVTFVENAVYSETTAAVKLNETSTIVGGFYRGIDGKRKSCILLIGNDGRLIENGYETGYLAYNLYEDNDNFVGDIVAEKNGGAYILGTTAQGSIYTGYLTKVSKDAVLDDDFSIPNTEDTGFIRIHNNKMVFPGTENSFQELDDTTYSEPKKLLMQTDGKLLVVGATRKQMNEVNYEDGESFVMRLFPDGRLDSSFGQNGVAHINLTDLCEDVQTAFLMKKEELFFMATMNILTILAPFQPNRKILSCG